MARTIVDEIIAIIRDEANNNPAPTIGVVTKIYTDDHVDVTTDTGDYRYIPSYGEPVINTSAILFFKDGDLNQAQAITLNGYTNLIEAKQDKLISGTNIKTINNTSLLGSGNITIEGGGGGGTINMVGAFTINDNGHLIVELPDGYSNPYSIDGNGHLIYNTSATTEE